MDRSERIRRLDRATGAIDALAGTVVVASLSALIYMFLAR